MRTQPSTTIFNGMSAKETRAAKWNCCVILLVFSVSLSFSPTSAKADTGGPDAFGYTFIDSNEPGGPSFNFEDISGTGTQVFLGDDQVSGAIPIGFTFNYYGINYTNVFISSNGFLTVLAGQSQGCCTGQPIPSTGSPNGTIAAWWEDLCPPCAGGAGLIHFQTLGSVPNRRFIVQFTDMPHFSSGTPVTFQWKLFETSGVIEMHYQAAPSDGGLHSVGIENETGTIGLQYSLSGASLTTPLAVRFTLGDCNGNAIDDECDIDCNAQAGACNVPGCGQSADCNGNGTPDECIGFEDDCNANGVPDECDIASGASQDCQPNGVPDECETDCNLNGVPDECDIASGASQDCQPNGIPDECETDCNLNGVPDECDIAGVELLSNGGFETGDFTGWSQINIGSGGIAINDGTLDPPGPDGPLPPCDGSFASVTFQGGPGRHSLYQEVTIPAKASAAVLSWTDRIRNHASQFSDPNQEFRVEIWDTNNVPLSEVFSTNPGDPLLNDCTDRSFDVSTFVGQTVRVAFTQEDNLFFFNAHIDNVRLVIALAGASEDCNANGIPDECELEACCLPGNSCEDLAPQCCVNNGGSPKGPGTVCLGIEACQFPDQTCQDIDVHCCLNKGGIPKGPGSFCMGIEACCLPDNTCDDIDAHVCLNKGGTLLGAGSQCTAPKACCLLDPKGTCADLDPLCCELKTGLAMGSGTACQGDANGDGVDDVCKPAIPTVSEWGLVILTLLLLTAWKIYFGGREPARK